MQRRQFTKEEAEAKVGKRVRSAAAFWAIPKGKTGEVTAACPSQEGFDVIVKWDVDRPVRGRPLRDWFQREEYEQFLEEIAA